MQGASLPQFPSHARCLSASIPRSLSDRRRQRLRCWRSLWEVRPHCPGGKDRDIQVMTKWPRVWGCFLLGIQCHRHFPPRLAKLCVWERAQCSSSLVLSRNQVGDSDSLLNTKFALRIWQPRKQSPCKPPGRPKWKMIKILGKRSPSFCYL